MSYPQQPYSQQPVAAQPAKRPWNVTLVAIIALLIGLLDVAAGVAGLLYRNNVDLQENLGLNAANVAISSTVVLVVGAIILLLSFGLFSGSRLARGVIAFIAVVRIAFTVVGAILAVGWEIWGVFAVEFGLSVLLLLLLFAGSRTKAFFARG